ncbi:MAG: glucosaminidase domain-containing protein [Actinobacteria bacterium]|nr:glucosaminidase domain-containing protein [Actinomycetota bacterium]
MRPTPRLVALLAGGTLLMVAVVIATIVAFSSPCTSRASAESAVRPFSHTAQATIQAQAADNISSLSTKDEPATSVLQPAEPYWRIKQRQAKAVAEALPADPCDVALPITEPAAATQTASHAPTITTDVVLTDGRTQIAGVWSGTAATLSRYLLNQNPTPTFTVPLEMLADLYVQYAAEANLRVDILWAQMLHETGFGRYGGDVCAAQNNYAGIGATGGGESGCAFATAQDGVKAHVAHMVAYVYTVSPVPWANDTTDPRLHAVRPRGSAAVLADLDGRWAVPGVGYGARIEEHVRAINNLER